MDQEERPAKSALQVRKAKKALGDSLDTREPQATKARKGLQEHMARLARKATGYGMGDPKRPKNERGYFRDILVKLGSGASQDPEASVGCGVVGVKKASQDPRAIPVSLDLQDLRAKWELWETKESEDLLDLLGHREIMERMALQVLQENEDDRYVFTFFPLFL